MTSFSFRIDPRKQKKGRFINEVRKELQKSVAEVIEEKGISQSDIAKLIGVNRSVLSRRLNGTANLTLSSIADLAWALGRDLQFRMVKGESHQANSNGYVQLAGVDEQSEDVVPVSAYALNNKRPTVEISVQES